MLAEAQLRISELNAENQELRDINTALELSIAQKLPSSSTTTVGSGHMETVITPDVASIISKFGKRLAVFYNINVNIEHFCKLPPSFGFMDPVHFEPVNNILAKIADIYECTPPEYHHHVLKDKEFADVVWNLDINHSIFLILISVNYYRSLMQLLMEFPMLFIMSKHFPQCFLGPLMVILLATDLSTTKMYQLCTTFGGSMIMLARLTLKLRHQFPSTCQVLHYSILMGSMVTSP